MPLTDVSDPKSVQTSVLSRRYDGSVYTRVPRLFTEPAKRRRDDRPTASIINIHFAVQILRSVSGARA